MSNTPDDIQLMALVKDGNLDAFRQIMERHQNSLLNFFRRSGADIYRAEDCVQETFIKLYNYRRKYKATAKFTTFLYTLARHSWADECRKNKFRHRDTPYLRYGTPYYSGVPEAKRSGAEDTEAISDSKQDCSDKKLDIEMALGKLSDKLRETIILNVYQGLDYQEIAEVLEIPLGTVKSRMSAAFEELRKILGEDEHE
ncbi:MAG: RNA polymerase sigma factor [Planctomycetes bacterium]|nr:RNA polymerase sigma factor [Planctomycetota bacterium]